LEIIDRIAAAKRLIGKVAMTHGKIVDILTLDALYAKAPIVHEALSHGMDVVVRMKEERRLIMKDAKGLFDARPPDHEWEERDSAGNRVVVRAWDESELTSWEQVNVPIRMIKMIRTTHKNRIVGGKPTPQEEMIERWIATTCYVKAISVGTISKIAAARWDIENNGFHELKTYLHMDHVYVHNPRAIEAVIGFMVLAVNLFYNFLFGHLHHFRDWRIPMSEVVEEMKEQLRWQPLQLLYLLWDTR
jgi:hypothetical protein